MKRKTFFLWLLISHCFVYKIYSQNRLVGEVDKALTNLCDSGAFFGRVLISKAGKIIYSKMSALLISRLTHLSPTHRNSSSHLSQNDSLLYLSYNWLTRKY